MKPLPLLVCLLLASPAFGQVQKYTNADLGRSVSSARVSAAEAAAILLPYQFMLPPPRPEGPRVMMLPGSETAGPYGEFAPFSESRRLDGTFLSDPPWQSFTFVPYYSGWRGAHAGGGRPGGSPRPHRSSGDRHDPAPSAARGPYGRR